MNTAKVRFITYRQNHHSPHSGYDRLVQFAPNFIEANPLSAKVVRSRLLWKLAGGVVAYDRTALATEIKSAWQMTKDSHTVYHILYGENTYHYLGSLNNYRQNRLVATFHLPPEYFRNVVKIDWHLQRLSGIICVGQTQVNFFYKDIIGEKRVFYVPHGIDTDYFCPPENFEKRDPDLCLFVGSYLRDFPTLRGVIELVSFLRPQTRFVAVTAKENFEKIGNHPNLTLKTGISETDLLKLYQTASILVIPMRDATGNNAVLEGMACGVPVVISDVGDTRDYTGSECSILIQGCNSRKMSEAVIDVLDNCDLRKKMSLQARQQALKFTWPAIFTQLQAIYDQVI